MLITEFSEEARMRRATEQGFSLPAYHGSPVADIKELEAKQPIAGVHGVYVSTQPDIANRFAKGGTVYPVLVRGPFASREYTKELVGDGNCYQTETNHYFEMIDRIKAEGYTGLFEDHIHNGLVVFEVKDVRSRFDRFAPETSVGETNIEASYTYEI